MNRSLVNIAEKRSNLGADPARDIPSEIPSRF